jgi:hypothetical protein
LDPDEPVSKSRINISRSLRPTFDIPASLWHSPAARPLAPLNTQPRHVNKMQDPHPFGTSWQISHSPVFWPSFNNPIRLSVSPLPELAEAKMAKSEGVFLERSPVAIVQDWEIAQNDTLLSTVYNTIFSGKKCIYSSNEHQKSRTCPTLGETLMQTLLEAAGPMGSTGLLP